MTGEEIEQLGLRLPSNSPYFRWAFREDPAKRAHASLAERLAAVKFDPTLGWNLASVYAAEGLGLPTFVCRSALLRANAFLLAQDHPDYRVALAQSLNLPESRAARDLLWALLSCSDISLEEVGTHYRCDLDVVQLVDQLFWNFRDRRREPGYVAQLLYRNTRAPGRADRKEDEAQPGLRLIRLGYEQGYQAVLQAAGYSALVDQNVTPERLAAQIARRILSQAALDYDMGLESKLQEQALDLVLQAGKQHATSPADEDRRRGLMGMSLSCAMNESFMRIMQPDLDRRLALMAGLSAEEQSEARRN